MKKKVKNTILQELKNEEIRENIISVKDLPYLLFVGLSATPRTIDINNPDNIIISIPADYKERIEKILCANNGWREKFSILIDINMYFKNQTAWEKEFDESIKNCLEEFDKTCKYDSINERFIINFSRVEIEVINNCFNRELMRLQDIITYEEFYQTLIHFTNLLSNKYFSKSDKCTIKKRIKKM